MGGEVDFLVSEEDNPEGFPRCPTCGEFIEVSKEDLGLYYCDGCDRTFPLDKAVL